MVLCVLLSGLVTQAIHPYVVPWVEKGINRIGPPPAAPAGASQETAKPPAATKSATKEAPGAAAQVYKQAEATIVEVMNVRPSPAVLTWCAVFVALFIGFNLVLGRVSRVWRK